MYFINSNNRKKVVVERRSYKARSASASFVEARIYRLSRRHPQKDRVVYFFIYLTKEIQN